MDFTNLFTLSNTILIAVAILFFGFLLALIVRKIITRILSHAELNRVLLAAGFRPLNDTAGLVAEYAIIIATTIIVLYYLGLARIVFIIAAIIVGIFLLATSILAIRDFIPALLLGFFVRSDLEKKIGQHITIGIVSGTLKAVGPINSIIEDNGTHYVSHHYTAKMTRVDLPD